MGSEEYLAEIIQDKELEIKQLKKDIRIILHGSIRIFSKNLEIQRQIEAMRKKY